MKKIILVLTFAVFGVIGVTAQTTKPIGMNKAKQIALKQTSGKITHSKTTKESGKPVYIVEVKNTSGEITKLKIDSAGNIVDNTTLTASQAASKKKKKHWWIF